MCTVLPNKPKGTVLSTCVNCARVRLPVHACICIMYACWLVCMLYVTVLLILLFNNSFNKYNTH